MPTMYSVLESDLVAEVCVSGPGSVQLQRPISYFVETMDDSAISKFTEELLLQEHIISTFLVILL